MKKGLLSLLAVALTIVSCQNYDDQFAELTGLVNTLSTEVAGVTQVQNDLSALTTLVKTLETSLGTVSGQTAQISNITTGLASATLSIDGLQDILDSGVATEQELTEVNSQVIDILAGVNTLLTKNASIQADLIITDSGTLATAQELILIGAQTPAKYILNGAATIDHTSLTAAEIAVANQLTAKLISITGATTVSGTVDLSGLTSLLGAYTIQSGSRPIDSTITTIGGKFTLDGEMGDVTYPNLRHVQGAGGVAVLINNEGEVTDLDFGSIATFAGTLNAPTAGSFTSTKSVSVKTGAFVMTAIDADSATLVELGQDTITGGLSIDATSAATINVNVATASTGTGDISITGSSTTNVFFNLLAAASDDIITTPALNHVAQFHIPKIATSINGLNISAGVVNAAALTTIEGTKGADFTGTLAIDLTAVKTLTDMLTVHVNPVNMPLAQFGVGSDLTSTATQVIIGGVLDTKADELSIPMTELTINNQLTSLVLDNAESVNLVSITVVASATNGTIVGLPIAFTASLPAALKKVTLSNFDEVTIAGNTSVASITTSGYGRNLTITGATSLAEMNVGHVYSPDYTDGQHITFTGNNNAAMKTLDLTSLVRLENALIFGNTNLDVITAPATTDLLTAGATLSYIVGVASIGGAQSVNSLTATYTGAVLAVQDGINDTPFIPGKIQQPSLKSWADYLIAVSATNTLTGLFEFDADSLNAGTETTVGTAKGNDTVMDSTAAGGVVANVVGGRSQTQTISDYAGTITTVYDLLLITN